MTYWQQYGVQADYPTGARAEVLALIHKHRRRPDILAQKMERLTLRLDGAYIAQIRSNT